MSIQTSLKQTGTDRDGPMNSFMYIDLWLVVEDEPSNLICAFASVYIIYIQCGGKKLEIIACW